MLVENGGTVRADALEAPIRQPTECEWGSDAIAEMLRRLDIPYIAFNPGSSFRGLHDSLVNHLGNERPRMLLCLHEENAVALAHGWAKVTGTPMLAIVHSNIGVMHAAMGLFNAYCDRVPMLLLGATGPVDAAKRRPFVDWLHTAKDQAAIIRPYVKWDAEPTSIPAAFEAILRAEKITRTEPCAPVYLCFDLALQEERLMTTPVFPERSRAIVAEAAWPAPATVAAVADLLDKAERPVILAGRVSRSPAGWAARIALAERLGAAVITDRRQAAAFPTHHPLNASWPAAAAGQPLSTVLWQADVVLSLDWVDLGGLQQLAWPDGNPPASIVHASLDHTLANGWSYDHFSLPPIDHNLQCPPEAAVDGLNAALGTRSSSARSAWFAPPAPVARPEPAEEAAIGVPDLAAALRAATAGRPTTLIRAPISWSESFWSVDGPLGYLGNDGAGGLGSAPGMAVGAALALRDAGSDRLPLSVFGDGEFMMGSSAIWTGVHYGVPLLIVVANNKSYFNDELHQERTARIRNRPIENRWIGQRISDPDIDLSMIARSQGAESFGPVERFGDLEDVLRQAIAAVDAGKVAVVDVRVEPGYDTVVRRSIVEVPTAETNG